MASLALWTTFLPTTSVPAANAHLDGTTLRYHAGGGEANVLTVDLVGSILVLRDTGAVITVDPGDGFAVISPNEVAIPAAAVTDLEIRLQDLDDSCVLSPDITLPASIQGDEGDDVIVGGSGDDVIRGGLGNNIVDGGAGFDTLVVDVNGGAGVSNGVELNTSDGQRNAFYNFELVNIRGGPGNDSIDVRGMPADAAFDIEGNDGDDNLTVADGNGVARGGNGVDTLIVLGVADVVLTDTTIAVGAGSTTLLDIERVDVRDDDDGHILDASATTGAYSLALEGNGGNDTFFTGSGPAASVAMYGKLGDDTYVFSDNWGYATIIEQEGDDTLDFSQVTTALEISLVPAGLNGGTSGASYINFSSGRSIENIIGGNGMDTLIGADQPNTWNLSANNAGSVGPVSFTAIENLTGGNSDDTFVFANEVSFSGRIDGDASLDTFGNDTLDWRAFASPPTVTASGQGTKDGQQGTASNLGMGFDNINALQHCGGGRVANHDWTYRLASPTQGRNYQRGLAADANGNTYVSGSLQVGLTLVDTDFVVAQLFPNGTEAWRFTYNGPGNSRDDAGDVAVDGAGNVYVVGTSRSGSTGESEDIVLIKLATNGTPIWVRRYDGPQHGQDRAFLQAIDAAGNTYVAGTTDAPGSFTGWDSVILKYDPDGNLLWSSIYNGPGNHTDQPSGLALDAAGQPHIAGRSKGVTSFDFYTIKYSSGGTQFWVARLNGLDDGDDGANSIALDENGNVYVAGDIQGAGSGSVKSGTVKYDSNGLQLWLQSFSGSHGAAFANAMVAHPQGGVVVVGGIQDAPYPNNDLTTIHYGDTGEEVWRFEYDGAAARSDNARAVTVDGCGAVYVAAYSGNSEGDIDILTLKIDRAGSLIWEERTAGVPNGEDRPVKIILASDGDVVIAGDSQNSSSVLDYAITVLKLSQLDNSPPEVSCSLPFVAESISSAGTTITLPAQVTDPDGDALTLTWSVDGNPVQTDSVPAGSPTTTATVSLTRNFALGTHTVIVTVSDGTASPVSCTTTVSVQDTSPPALTCPSNLVLPCSTSLLVSATFEAAATDAVDLTPVITYSHPPGSGFPVGVTTVHVTARDASGNESTCSFTVTRAALGFSGFHSPIGGADATGGSLASPLRTFKLKSTIPVKFSAYCDGSPVLTGIHTLQAVKWTDETTSEAPLDATPTDPATTGNQFRLTGSDWHFNLDAEATGMSTGKWQLTATLSDGSQHSAWIQIK